MKTLLKLFFMAAANALAIWAAAWLIDGIDFEVTLFNLLLAGLILGLANGFIKPFLKILTFPLIILTLGMFTVIINIVVLTLVAWMFDFFTIEGFWAAFWGVLVISFVNYLTNLITEK